MLVPYHKQQLWYSCFAACIRMILEYYGIEKSEREIILLSRITPKDGGFWPLIELGLETLGLHFYWGYMFSLDELKELVKNETPVIVSLRFESVKEHFNHAVVVADVTDEFIIVNDPELGPNIRMGIKQFLEAWSNRGYIAGFIKHK